MKIFNNIFRKKKIAAIEQERYEMELIYTDRLLNKWYQYKHAAGMPNIRNLEAQIKAREAQNNITDEALKFMIKKMKEAGNKGQVVEMFGILTEMENRLEAITDTEILLSFACVYYCLNDEDPGTYSRVIQEKKRKIWEEDEECRGFFLLSAFKRTFDYKDICNKDINTLLREEEERRKRWQSYHTKTR